MKPLHLLRILALLFLLAGIPACRTPTLNKQEAAEWYTRNASMVRWVGYQGSDERFHHFIARVMGDWNFIRLRRDELTVEDERPYSPSSSAPLFYYLVDPSRGYVKIEGRGQQQAADSNLRPAGQESSSAYWATSDMDLGYAISKATAVVAALSTSQASISNRSSSHISTMMTLGSGKTIHGGGSVTHVRCLQEFRVLKLLHGKRPSKSLVLEYGFIEKSAAFPGPKTQFPIPTNEKIILLLGETNSLLKALPDTLQNRTTIKEMHNKNASHTASLPPSEVVADSVSDFSGKQGVKGWSYGYWERSADADKSYDQAKDFRLLRHFGRDPINRISGRSEFTTGELWNLQDGLYYTSLWAAGGHPNSAAKLGEHAAAEQWAVRRWISTTNGPVTISGYAGKTMPWGEKWGGGVQTLIVVDGATLFRAAVENLRTNYSIEATVKVGSLVDFLIGPNPSVGVIDFTATVRTAPALSR